MIIVQLLGGLGNQMFQYATGRRLAHAHNSVLKLDISAFNQRRFVTDRKYALSPFNIQSQIASIDEIEALTLWPAAKTVNFFPHLFRRFPWRPPTYIHCFEVPFQSHILNLPDGVYLEGYWQSEKYFKDIAQILRQELTLKGQPAGENLDWVQRIQSCSSVSVHVRRRDFLMDTNTHQTHGVCSLDYYERAVHKVDEVVKSPVFFVFSDDHRWAKENLRIPFPANFIDNNQQRHEEDFRLMNLCRHHILANSSFSWWSAWLNPNPDKIVIAPWPWFKDLKYDIRDILPDDWFKVKA